MDSSCDTPGLLMPTCHETVHIALVSFSEWDQIIVVGANQFASLWVNPDFVFLAGLPILSEQIADRSGVSFLDRLRDGLNIRRDLSRSKFGVTNQESGKE